MIFIYLLSTVSFNIFIGTIKQIMKFVSYLTTVTILSSLGIPYDRFGSLWLLGLNFNTLCLRVDGR